MRIRIRNRLESESSTPASSNFFGKNSGATGMKTEMNNGNRTCRKLKGQF